MSSLTKICMLAIFASSSEDSRSLILFPFVYAGFSDDTSEDVR